MPDCTSTRSIAHEFDESGSARSAASAAGPQNLAPREVEVLRLVAVGMRNGDVAAELGLSTETARSYLRSAMRRPDVHNRSAAVHAARMLGVL